MPARYIHPALLADLQGNCTSLSMLCRVIPRTPGFDQYGVTDNNVTLTYDAGDGALAYSAPVGFEPSELVTGADLSVGNMEARSLMPSPVYDIPVSEEAIAAGLYDYAEVRIYLVNFLKLETGRHCTLFEGTVGQVRVRDDGTSFVNELRSLSAQLKQEICTKYTKTCRAIDGTQKIGSALPGPQVKRDWCGVDFTVYLKTATVEEAGLENTLTFKVLDSDIDGDWAENAFAPGRVWWTSGRNAGREVEIMSNTADGWITLRHEVGYPIEPTDELEYRVGCSFMYDDAEKGCLAHAGAQRVYVFKGYPRIPTENEAQLMTPGATVGPGRGGQTSVPFSTEAE